MSKEYSIGYKFKGDTSGFQKAVGDINKNFGSLRKGMTGMISTLKSFAAAAGIAFSVRAMSKWAQESVKLAAVAGNLGKVGKDSVGDLDDIKTAWRDIRINIGEAILESEGFNTTVGKIKTLTEKIREHGFMGGLFVSQKKWNEILAEKLKYDVTSEGLPWTPTPPKPHKTEEDLKTSKETVKTVADYVMQIKEAAIETNKMAEAWKIIREEISKAMGGPIKPVDTSQLGMPAFGVKLPGVQDLPRVLHESNEETEKLIANLEKVTGTFTSMFTNLSGGFDQLINSMIEDLRRWVAEVIAKQILLFIIKMLLGGGKISPVDFSHLQMPNFKNILPGLQPAPKFIPAIPSVPGLNISPGSPMNFSGGRSILLKGDWKLSGRDNFLSVRRYEDLLGETT